jgi:hypothetical protein
MIIAASGCGRRRQTQAIAEAHVKTDKVDARNTWRIAALLADRVG